MNVLISAYGRHDPFREGWQQQTKEQSCINFFWLLIFLCAVVIFFVFSLQTFLEQQQHPTTSTEIAFDFR